VPVIVVKLQVESRISQSEPSCMNHEKKYFFRRLNPPRSTFATNMSEEERAIMQQHAAYWMPHLDDGTLIVLGPVMDPKGVFGVAVLAVDTEKQLHDLVSNDPAMAFGSIDVYPMRAVTKQL